MPQLSLGSVGKMLDLYTAFTMQQLRAEVSVLKGKEEPGKMLFWDPEDRQLLKAFPGGAFFLEYLSPQLLYHLGVNSATALSTSQVHKCTESLGGQNVKQRFLPGEKGLCGSPALQF